MIGIKVTGVEEAIRKLNTISSNLRAYTMDGMEESGLEVLKPKIIAEDPVYGRTTEVRRYEELGVVTVGPSLEYAPLRELSPSRVRSVFRYAAPWWTGFSQKLISRIPTSEVLRRVAEGSIGEVRETIIRVIIQGIRGA